jgi:hypothetical protein
MTAVGITRRRLSRLKLALSLVLGPPTTVGVAWASAAWVPVEKAGGTIALEGEHLGPWLIELKRATAARIIWFEKGRIWGRPNTSPPNGVMAAVSCWSFAESARLNPRMVKGDVRVPESLEQVINHPQVGWGAAEDTRGWPLGALRTHIVGTVDPRAPSAWICDDGVLLRSLNPVRENLATVRVLPLSPTWGGALADTALFVGGWWMAFTAAGGVIALIRSRLRLRAGQCPKCRYDLRGDLPSGCPECGWNRR